jgi:hypothetical protein
MRSRQFSKQPSRYFEQDRISSRTNGRRPRRVDQESKFTNDITALDVRNHTLVDIFGTGRIEHVESTGDDKKRRVRGISIAPQKLVCGKHVPTALANAIDHILRRERQKRKSTNEFWPLGPRLHRY